MNALKLLQKSPLLACRSTEWLFQRGPSTFVSSSFFSSSSLREKQSAQHASRWGKKKGIGISVDDKQTNNNSPSCTTLPKLLAAVIVNTCIVDNRESQKRTLSIIWLSILEASTACCWLPFCCPFFIRFMVHMHRGRGAVSLVTGCDKLFHPFEANGGSRQGVYSQLVLIRRALPSLPF